MDPQELINIIKALDELVETAIKKTVYDKDFDGLSLLDYINNKSYDYDYLVDTFPRDDGLLVYGPYDLEKITGAGRSDLNLVIEPIISDTDDTIQKFRVSLQDQNTVASSGLAMRQDIDNIFVLELGEFSTIEEMENLFTQTSDINGTNAKVSLVGNKLDEIFPNSEADIELVLSNEKPLISETVRQRVDRNFMPEYIAQAMEDLDNETATQYSELAGDVEIPDTPEGAAADIVPDDISSIDTPTNVAGAEVIDEIEGIQSETLEKLRNSNDEFVAEQVDDIMAKKINEVLPFVDTSLSRAEAIGISTTGPQITTSADPTLNAFIDDIEKITGQTLDIKDKRKLRQFLYDVAKGNDNLLDNKKSFIPDLQDGVNSAKLNDPGYKIWKNWQHSGAFRPQTILDMTVNEYEAFGKPSWVKLVEGLDKSGEVLDFTAISDVDLDIPDTPTNVVDDTPKQSNILDNITRELGGVDYVEFYTRKNNDKFPSVGVNVDANGNIIIFRATDDPNRLINSNFKQISSDSSTSGMGQQNYFSTDFLYSKEYSYRGNNKIYGFNTNIKPEEILQLNKTLNDYPDLAKALQPQSIFTKPEYKNTPIHYLISQQMNISPEIWNKNIPIIKSLGYKAIGTPFTGQPHNYGVNYEIVPLIDDNKNVEIIPISEIKYRGVNPETDQMLNSYDRESYEVVKLDTPTNVVDDVTLRENEIAGITNDYVQNNWNEPKTTGDAIVMRVNDDGIPEILMIQRTNPPHTDKWALPGGIVDQQAIDFMDSADQKNLDELSELGEKNKEIFFKANERTDRKYIKYVILNELMEEVGLDVVEQNLDLNFIGVKNNRFDWDARATKGVSVGGGFIFIKDNTWEPKAGSDAKNAKWIKLKDIVDKNIEVAFGHVEWIVNVLQDRNIGLNYFGNSFDDNPKYLYGVDKPNETLGDYDDVINKLNEIADENKSENVKLMEEANIVREQKGMDLIPIDRSNIQGTTERLYRDIRFNLGDWEKIKEVLSQSNTKKSLYDYVEKYAVPAFTIDDIEITDDFINRMNAEIENNAAFEMVLDPEKVTKENIFNLSGYKDPSVIETARIDVTLNENGRRKIAKSIQENLLKGLEAQVEFIKQYYKITDPVFLNTWAENYRKQILQNDFVDKVAALIDPKKTPITTNTLYNKTTGQITFIRDYDTDKFKGILTYINDRNPFFTNEVIEELLDGPGQIGLVDSVFEEFEFETARDFFMENTENFGDKLNQKAAYVDENRILHFQTNHGSAGPSESALNLIEYINDKYKNNPDVKDITTLLQDQVVNFLDKDLKYITPYHNGPNGLLGKVFYTTTNPFVGMGYGLQNANSTTPGTVDRNIKLSLTEWLKELYKKGNDEVVNEVIEAAKKFGIVISIDRPDLGAFTNREDVIRNQTEFKIKPLNGTDINFGSATVSNIQGEVNVDNVLFANQSVKAGNRRAKLRKFYTAALEQFDNWWIDELNTPRFLFNVENHVFGLNNMRYDVLNNRFITYEDKSVNYTLSDDYKQIISFDQLKPIEGAEDVSTAVKYYEWLERTDPNYKPMVSALVGFGDYNQIWKALQGTEQLKQNQIVLSNKIFELIGKDVKENGIGPEPFLKKGQAGIVADYLDSIHHQFSINQSIQIQELANYFRVSEALKEGDYDTARKLLPGLIIPETPTLDNQMIDVDTDEALYRSQFVDNVEKIIDDIDSELTYFLDKRNNKNKPFNFTEKLNTIENKALGSTDDPYGGNYTDTDNRWIEAEKDFSANNENIGLDTSEQIDKKRQRIYNFAEANNVKINLNTDNDVIEFLDTASRFSLFTKNGKDIVDTLATDRIIFSLAGNYGYEIMLGTGGGMVGGVPHYMIGLIDPNNTLQTNEPKTLKVKVVNIAHFNEAEAQIFKGIQGRNLSELTDSEFKLLTKYMDPSILETQITEETKENFSKIIKDNQVMFAEDIGLSSIVSGPNQTVDVTLLMLDEEITKVAAAVRTGQAPKEVLENLLNQYAITLANAPEDIKAKILTAGNKSLDLLNNYGIKGVKGIGQAARVGFKLADRYDWAVLGPAFIDILSSRIYGPGTQFETIGGALGDTINRYEDVEGNSVMEMLYGNKNVQEATGIFGLNIAYPVVKAIEAGKDAFKTYVYDNNFLGIESLFTFLKPKAINALKKVTDEAGLNDWVYNVKRDLIVDTLMKNNNVPYTKNNVDLYTKYYEENNPRTKDRYGNELPANYEQNWTSSRPSNVLSSGFSTDERIRTGERYARAGGGSGQKKE